MPTTSRSGAATGTGTSTATHTAMVAGISYERLAGRIQGQVEGFALANNITETQAFAALKKHLVW